jgi:hypothetical protein
MFFPWTRIDPNWIGYIPKRVLRMEVFPEPVLPQKAIFSPFLILRLKSFSANSPLPESLVKVMFFDVL